MWAAGGYAEAEPRDDRCTIALPATGPRVTELTFAGARRRAIARSGIRRLVRANAEAVAMAPMPEPRTMVFHLFLHSRVAGR